MQLGKYFKDGSICYVDITRIEKGLCYGISYLIQSLNPDNHFDDTEKFWVVSMHKWEPFDENKWLEKF